MYKKIILIVFGITLAACAPVGFTPEPPIAFVPPEGYVPFIFDGDIQSPASPERLQDERPNIIVIMTDDQPFHTIAYMPTLMDQLSAKGVNFVNGFATTPLCCPSRVSILTGEYAHNHQVLTNRAPLGGALKFDTDEASIAVWLSTAGYRTGYYGKYLNDYEALTPPGYVPPGWDEWGAFLDRNVDKDAENLQYYSNFSMSENGVIAEYKGKQANFSTDLITKKSVNFIGRMQNEAFFLFVGYYNPHSPYISAPRHDQTFRSGSGWDWLQYRPPNFNEANIRDKPAYLSELSPLSGEEIDTAHKQILRSLLSVDDGIASILNAVDQAGLKEKTMIVFISDNGMTLGDHRFGVTKNCPYEACVKIPFIVYAPGMFTARSDDHLVANIDLAPTFLELAGVAIPNSVNGQSLVPLLRDGSATWREEILFEHWPTEEGSGAIIPEFYAVRTAAWKYVEYVTGEKELYDLADDPYELTNLAGKWSYRDIEAELALRLTALKQE